MYVFAVQSALVGRGVSVAKGDVFHASDPLVHAHPELFSRTPPTVRSTPGWSPPADVEQATAAPGERRTVKRGG